MREAGIRDQGSGISPRRGLALARKCATDGCNRLVWNDDFCPRCEEEIRALDRMAEEEKMRAARATTAREIRRMCERDERLAEFRAAVAWGRRWLWVATLLFVAGGMLYLGFACVGAIFEWLGAH